MKKSELLQIIREVIKEQTTPFNPQYATPIKGPRPKINMPDVLNKQDKLRCKCDKWDLLQGQGNPSWDIAGGCSWQCCHAGNTSPC